MKVAQSCLILWNPMDRSPPGSSVHGKNTGVGCHAILQGVFLTPGSNPGLPHCRQFLYRLSHQESPRILEWVAYPFSKGSSQPRNRTGVSCIAGRFFTNWAIREVLLACSLRVIIHFRTLSFDSFWYIKWNRNISWNRDRCPVLLTGSRLLNLFGSILFFLLWVKIIFFNVLN